MESGLPPHNLSVINGTHGETFILQLSLCGPARSTSSKVIQATLNQLPCSDLHLLSIDLVLPLNITFTLGTHNHVSSLDLLSNSTLVWQRVFLAVISAGMTYGHLSLIMTDRDLDPCPPNHCTTAAKDKLVPPTQWLEALESSITFPSFFSFHNPKTSSLANTVNSPSMIDPKSQYFLHNSASAASVRPPQLSAGPLLDALTYFLWSFLDRAAECFSTNINQIMSFLCTKSSIGSYRRKRFSRIHIEDSRWFILCLSWEIQSLSSSFSSLLCPVISGATNHCHYTH